MGLNILRTGWQHALRLMLGRDDSDNALQVRLAAIDGVDDQGRLVVIILGQDPSGDPIQIATDAEGRLLGAYEGDLTVTMGDVEKLLADDYYSRLQPYLYASGRLKYICRNTDIDAALADTDWRIWKLTDASQPAKEGSRTGRADSDANITADHSWNI